MPKYQKNLEICPKNLKILSKTQIFFRKNLDFWDFWGKFLKFSDFGGKFPKFLEIFKKNLKNLRKKSRKKNSIEEIFFFRRILSPDFWYFFTMNLKIRLNPKSYELVISVLWQLSYGTWTVLLEGRGRGRYTPSLTLVCN